MKPSPRKPTSSGRAGRAKRTSSKPRSSKPAALGITSLAIQRRGIWIVANERQKRNHEMLSRALSLGTTVAFVGAGCSRDSGLPSWTQFAANAVETVEQGLSRVKNYYQD